MITLGLDVCSGSCAVAVVEGERALESLSEPMVRGHVERLAPMVDQVLETASIAPRSLDIVAVTTGPGSFTGARLGVAFARGLALSTGAKPVGVTVFEAMAEAVGSGTTVVALDGRRDDLFVQRFDDRKPVAAAQSCGPDDAWRIAAGVSRVTVLGSGGDLFLSHAPEAIRDAAIVANGSYPAETVARIGARQVIQSCDLRPAPLYMRAADAKPAA